MADKYLNLTAIQTLKTWAKSLFATDADLDALSDRVDDIVAEGGEPNVIEIVKVNNSALTPDANKAVNIDLSGYAETSDIPLDLSDLTNTGADPYATESYVDQNGGKIDSISIDGTTQTIDANKNVALNLSAYAKSADVPSAVSDLTDDVGIQTASDVTSAISTALANNGDPYQTQSEVEAEIRSQISGAYKPQGAVAFANLPALSSSIEGYVYNVTNAFTTTADFIEGAGHKYPAGTNVVCVEHGTGTYKWDCLTGTIDLSAYWTSVSGEANTLEAATVAEIQAILNA